MALRSQQTDREEPCSCRPIIVLEYPAESFPTPNLALGGDFTLVNAFVPQTLVGSLGMIVIQVFGYCPTKRSFSEEDYPLQALSFNRQDEPLRISVAVWGLAGRPDHIDTRLPEDPSKL